MSSLAKRLLDRDVELWPTGNVSANRMGWLDSPRRAHGEAPELARWAATVGQSKVVLLGMGGSSLGPEVLGAALAATGRAAARELVVLDTTSPETVSAIDFSDAFVLVSSKSGTTLEVHTLLAHALSVMDDPRRYAAITDPGTPLEKLAAERGFSRTFVNPPDIGGRYSVLSYFGLVPACLLGYDVEELATLALEADVEEAVALGHDMGAAALEGRDKVTIKVTDEFRSFGLWVEQIIAESTGKQGKGCVPVPTTQDERGDDRHHVELTPTRAEDLAREFYRWELATPIAGHVLGIDPFDEPNVAESKQNTSKVLDNLPLPPVDSCPAEDALGWLTQSCKPGDYVSIQAYLPFGHDAQLESARRRVRDALGGRAVTVGYGPRFLHSTGQLHKGGPNTVLALQIVIGSDRPELAIPGYPYDFATLQAAQAAGDLQSLAAHDRRALRVSIDSTSEIDRIA